jgi:probable HAF family extracellular repeat protein
MSKTTLSILSSLLLSTALAAPATAGSPQHAPGKHPGLPHYVLFDVGTFGGEFSNFFGPATRQLNSHGDAVGANNTSLPDPLDPLCFENCLVDHGFEWKNGGTNDLGALFGSSVAIGLNDKGLVAGLSQNGKIDNDTGIFELRAVAWKSGKIKDLGTLGGTQSSGGTGVNNLGQVAVQSTTADSNDAFIGVSQANCIWLPTTQRDCHDLDFGINALFLPVTTSTHGAVWSKEAGLKDAGTLGGPDSTITDINDSSQAVGWSYNSYNAGNSGVPDTRPFLWDNGTATDLGSLGGTFGEATLINQNGQVTGTSNLPGDTEVRPFIWDKANGMHDLGSLGGDYGHGDWINDLGDIVGFSRTTQGSIMGHAFYWHDGSLGDLGVIGDDPESEANVINNKGMIVGEDFDRDIGDLRGWISDQGSSLVDLNTLIRKPHGLYIIAGVNINDRNVIAANAVTQKGETHAVILVPENEFDMLAKMNAAVGNAPRHDEPAPVAPRSRKSHAQHPNCAAERRFRPAICNRG